MNGVFLFSSIFLFFVIHILLQSTYLCFDSDRFLFVSSIPELVIFFLCLFTGEMDYFLIFLFSYLVILNFLFFFFSYLQKKFSPVPHFFFLFFLLYLFVLYAISFHSKTNGVFSFSIPSLCSLASSFLFFLLTFQKSEESFSLKRTLYLLLLIIQSFFLFFLCKVYMVSPVFMGIICSFPKGAIFLKGKEEKNAFSYFLKEEFYHYFLLGLFDFFTSISIVTIKNPYLLKCCHFGMFSHIFFLFYCNHKKEKWKIVSFLFFLFGTLFIFFFS